ncbi:MAG TPA: hypothetical protein VL475_15885, partial [Planctomycetaceae bacterium]|nr:hypothetical protein [Planctomycetaceae bacterium]
GAVTVSALVSVWKDYGHVQINPLLWVGVVGIVFCAAMVAYFTPHVPPAGGPPSKAAVPAVVEPQRSPV